MCGHIIPILKVVVFCIHGGPLAYKVAVFRIHCGPFGHNG